MTILIIGEHQDLAEAELKFGSGNTYLMFGSHLEAMKAFDGIDVVFDFIIDEDPTRMEVYRERPSLVAFLNTTKTNLATLCESLATGKCATLFGFCGMPTFLNRPILETSVRDRADYDKLSSVCQKLGSEFLVVEDRVGLVTPRVICMIINEAYFTAEDGTAAREDIDLAMKLGTNYPFGPFEWAKRIGVRNVRELLVAVLKASGDPRYQVSAMLDQECKET